MNKNLRFIIQLIFAIPALVVSIAVFLLVKFTELSGIAAILAAGYTQDGCYWFLDQLTEFYEDFNLIPEERW